MLINECRFQEKYQKEEQGREGKGPRGAAAEGPLAVPSTRHGSDRGR